MHLNDEQIQRLLHDELDDRAKEGVSLHVADCNACAQRLAQAEREESEVFGLLGSLDHPAPPVEASQLVGRGRGFAAAWGRRVAIFVVAAAVAGAAYAIPGSPLPTWVKQVAELIRGQSATTTPQADEGATRERVVSGVAMPVTRRFTVAFLAEQGQGTITVSLTDGANVMVRALGAGATFTTEADRLTVDNRNSAADFEIDVPRDAPYVELQIGPRRLVLKDGERFAEGLTTDARGRALLSLTPSGR